MGCSARLGGRCLPAHPPRAAAPEPKPVGVRPPSCAGVDMLDASCVPSWNVRSDHWWSPLPLPAAAWACCCCASCGCGCPTASGSADAW
eukprot:346308-Chlamydomonas_euryale.AAC.1